MRERVADSVWRNDGARSFLNVEVIVMMMMMMMMIMMTTTTTMIVIVVMRLSHYF